MAKSTGAARRLHAFYSGSVQGVGFRYTAERIAGSLGLTGWARNLPDGRVEIICEGSGPGIEIFLSKINDIFKTYIRGADVEWGDALGEFNGFGIRF